MRRVLTKTLKCSFCGRRETEVAKLVAGTGGRGSRPTVYICDRCVEKASGIMEEAESSGNGAASEEPSVWKDS